MKTIRFELNEILGIGLTLVILGIGISYGLQVMSNVQSDMATDSPTTSVTNESVTFVNNTYVALTENGIASLSCSAVRDSNHTAIDSALWSCNVGQGVKAIDDGTWTEGHTDDIYVDYAYADGSSEYTAIGNSVEGVAVFPEKIGTIVTVVIASLIIGILTTYLWARFR